MKKKGKILILGISFLGAWYSVSFVRSSMPILKKPSLIVLIDPLINSSYQKKLNAIISSYERITVSNTYLLQNIKELFPEIKQVSLADTAGNRIKNKRIIKLIAHKPVVKINETELLLENGTIVLAGHFDQKFINSLYQVQVKKDKQVLSIFAQKYNNFQKSADLEIFEKYKISWYDEQSILLDPKDNQYSAYIGTAETIFNTDLLKACALVEEKLIAQEKDTKKNKKWFLDVRFKNQIVAFNKKEGMYEKSIC